MSKRWILRHSSDPVILYKYGAYDKTLNSLFPQRRENIRNINRLNGCFILDLIPFTDIDGIRMRNLYRKRGKCLLSVKLITTEYCSKESSSIALNS